MFKFCRYEKSFNFIQSLLDKVTVMSRSKRFRVSHVTSEGNRALARSDIDSQIKKGHDNKPPRKNTPDTSHEVKIVIARKKYTAKCLNCDFESVSHSGFLAILFDAEDHGRITELEGSEEHKKVVQSWIGPIREGQITREMLPSI